MADLSYVSVRSTYIYVGNYSSYYYAPFDLAYIAARPSSLFLSRHGAANRPAAWEDPLPFNLKRKERKKKKASM